MHRFMREGMDRRQFLQVGTAAIGITGLSSVFAADAKKDDPFGGFTLGVQSYTFREFDLEQALKRTQALGLHFIELYQKHAPLESKPEQIKAILKLCGDYDIKPVAWGVQGFDNNADKSKRIFEFGKAMGLKTISADPSVDSFDILDKLCDEYKISIGIHPHGPQGKTLHHWYSAEVILDAVKDHNPLIGTCIDTGHLIRSAVPPFNKKLDPAQQVKLMGARNFGMHLKDHDNAKDTDVVFGKGVLDVASVLKALKEVKFNGYISIEYEANEKNPSPDVQACIEVFKEAVKKA